MFGLSHGQICHFNQMFQSKIICVFYEYAYLYYAYVGRSIHECLNVHIASHTSCPDMQERHLLHESILLNMYKMDIFKIQIPNIWVLFWFISKKNHIFEKHWYQLVFYNSPILLCLFCKKVAIFFPLVGTSVKNIGDKPKL
jgi:hypothetical protein